MKNFRLFYCPNCDKEEITNENLYKDERTIINMRDGCGRPIRHYKCECGNYLAGMVGHINGNDDILYYKEVIKMYNNEETLLEKAKICYEDRKNDDS